jgi:hypothetical protein
VSADTALSVCEFLVKSAFLCIHGLLIAQTCHLVILLVPKIKLKIKGCHFQTLDSVQKAVTDIIKMLAEADFQSCYEAWKIHWAKCVASEGYYFEVDSVDLDK